MIQWKKKIICLVLAAIITSCTLLSPVQAADSSTEASKNDKSVKVSQVLIIGDCRVEGMKNKKIIRSSRIIGVVGASAYSIWLNHSREIKSKGKNTKKVYIALGLNSAESVSRTTNYMKTLVKHVKKCCPKAEIIIQNVIPENLKEGQSDCGVTNKKIRQINKNYQKIAAKDKRVTYYKIKSKVKYCGDRVHFYEQSYKKLAKEIKKYLRIKK